MKGLLQKMDTLVGQPITYLWLVDGHPFEMNSLLGSHVCMRHTGTIYCSKCGTKIRKTFQEGLCFRCFQTAPEASPCIFRPELCRAHLGEGRDLQWEETHHNRPHVVYLALSSSVKVGVTRSTQIPYRWIDQGASAAIRIVETPNRYEAGRIEVLLKNYFTDTTNWQRMLKNQVDTTVNLKHYKQECFHYLPTDAQSFFIEDEEAIELHYPVTDYPKTIKSVSFDKQNELNGRLIGIKGQYLLFEGGFVLNVRKHTGYEIQLFIG